MVYDWSLANFEAPHIHGVATDELQDMEVVVATSVALASL